MSNLIIRRAKKEDILEMIELGAQMHAESLYQEYAFDKARVHQTLSILTDSDIGVSIVAEKDGVIVGGMIGMVTQHYFGPDKVASDYALFISPTERVGRLAIKIIRAWVEAAKEAGANHVTVSNSTGVNIEGVKDLYTFVGFEHVGYVFDMRLK